MTATRFLVAAMLVMFLQACELDVGVPPPPPIPATFREPGQLPAAAYFQWAQTAGAEPRAVEMARLQEAINGVNSVIPLVQRAILIYHDEDNGNAIADVDLERPIPLACQSDRRCRDYATFASIFRELMALEAQVEVRDERVSTLQDRIRVLDQQIEALTNQIEALTDIEQQLLERERRTD